MRSKQYVSLHKKATQQKFIWNHAESNNSTQWSQRWLHLENPTKALINSIDSTVQ